MVLQGIGTGHLAPVSAKFIQPIRSRELGEKLQCSSEQHINSETWTLRLGRMGRTFGCTVTEHQKLVVAGSKPAWWSGQSRSTRRRLGHGRLLNRCDCQPTLTIRR